MMKFLGFSKIGMDFSLQIYFSKKKKKILKIYFWKNFIPDFGKGQKFHDFVFSSPGFERTCFGREFVEHDFFLTSNVSDEKSVLITFISSGNEISNSQPPFLDQFLGADFKLSFILPIKPKVFPFLRMEDGFHFLQKLKG